MKLLLNYWSSAQLRPKKGDAFYSHVFTLSNGNYLFDLLVKFELLITDEKIGLNIWVIPNFSHRLEKRIMTPTLTIDNMAG